MTDSESLFELMGQFLAEQIDAESFCSRFTQLWMRNRDALYAVKGTWPRPYDQELIADHQRGAISTEQFDQKWIELWGYKGTELRDEEIVCATHSACACFRPVPELSWEIDEAELRGEVAARLAEREV